MAGSPESPGLWSPLAEQDLADIWRYYANAVSVETADDLAAAILHAASRVAERPLSGRSREELKPGLRSILSSPYIVFYRVARDTVEIVRVLHERRNLAAEISKGD
jgi:toxin ParE1/3/4